MASEKQDQSPEEHEDAPRRFEGALKRILSVPKAELIRREAAYQKSRRRKTSIRKAR